jgi:hypothetical protein
VTAEYPRHTPYDGSAKPFTIGLKPLDLSNWIEIDDYLEAYLAEKKRLYAAIPGQVFAEEPGTREAQQEVLELLEDHLRARLPKLADHREDAEPDLPPLQRASLLVQDDLVLMRKGDDGWRLAAAALCFPASWSLAEKFRKPLQDIHEPVPGFGRGTRTAEIINRIFDKLQVEQPVERHNWSLQADGALYMPLSDLGRIERAAQRPERFSDEDVAARAFIRVERQTLRKLPRSGDILFTIRTYLDPLGALRRHPDRARIAASFADQLMSLGDGQLGYKGLAGDRDRVVSALREIASCPA